MIDWICRPAAWAGGYPNADRIMEHALLLPCNHFMTGDDVDFVCLTIAEVVEHH